MTLSNEPNGGAPGIGARLRAAREARGLTYEAVAAELRIRVVILTAIEEERHDALPERVYLLGFLRTYARFLGIDPVVVAASWAGESGIAKQESGGLTAPAKHATEMKSSLRVWFRSLMGLGVVGLTVLTITGFLIIQVVRFASPPGLSVISPARDVLPLPAGTHVTVMRGTAGVGTQILIQNSIGDSVTTEADASGVWSIEVPLIGGRNEFDISAADPATGSANSAPVRRVLIVALPLNDAPQLDVLNPSAGLRVSGGPIPISLSTLPNGTVLITATNEGGEVVSSSLTAQPDGKVQSDLLLPKGAWHVSLQVSSAGGTTSEVLRDVEVVFAGVTVTLIGSDIGTWIRVWIDGAVDPLSGPSGVTLAKGESRTIRGLNSVEIRFGNPRGALVALNGRMLGERGAPGVPESWSFRADGRVLSSNRK
jgi:cytoskeleton protein RodZ